MLVATLEIRAVTEVKISFATGCSRNRITIII